MKAKTKARYARLVATEPAPLAPEASGAGSAATTQKTPKKTARKALQKPSTPAE